MAPSNQAAECFLLLLLALACSQQYPLVEERLQGVGDKAAPTRATLQDLRDLEQHIEANQVGRPLAPASQVPATRCRARRWLLLLHRDEAHLLPLLLLLLCSRRWRRRRLAWMLP